MEPSKCRTCCLSDKIKNLCLKTGTTVNLDEDFCSKHSENLPICEVCGNYIAGDMFLDQDSNEKWHSICGKCSPLLNTCKACPNIRVCEFETNPDPMPKIIMKTIQQGNMTMQTQARNEDRVKKFCINCKCWIADDINACAKDFNVGCVNKQDFWSSRNPS